MTWSAGNTAFTVSINAGAQYATTTTANLYPLCRTHHRLKTTGGWDYLPIDGEVTWRTPHGQRHIH